MSHRAIVLSAVLALTGCKSDPPASSEAPAPAQAPLPGAAEPGGAEPEIDIPALGGGAPGAERPVGKAVLQSGDTVQVVDLVKADELVVEKGGEHATVRMKGIHAFGSINYDADLQTLGAQSKALVREELVGKAVKVELGLPPKDEHGRYLGYVSLGGVDQNRRLIELGQAVVYTEYAFEREDDYSAAEKAAREAKKALWSRPAAVTLIENLRDLWKETRHEMPASP